MQLPKYEQLAIFADFDGTLVDIAPTPDSIIVNDDLKNLLVRTTKRTRGACAVVTGRAMHDIQNYLGDCDLAIAASHGGQWRLPGQATQSIEHVCNELERYKKAITGFASDYNLLVETKQFAIAVHLRQHPEHEQHLDAFFESLHIGPNYSVIRGKAVRELKPKQANKGAAIERFMAMAPFSGKTPLFVGDDVTDEDGFRYINSVGGISIKVGPGESRAQHRLSHPADVRNLFTQITEA